MNKFFCHILLVCLLSFPFGCKSQTNIPPSATVSTPTPSAVIEEPPTTATFDSNDLYLPDAPQTGQPQNLRFYLTDTWVKTDGDFEDCRLHISFSSPEDLCIQSNHIYAKVKYKLNTKKKKVSIFLIKTTDLSPAALTTPWKDIDKSKPIAIIDVSKALSNGLIEVNWIGLYNKRTGEIYDFGEDAHQGLHKKLKTINSIKNKE